MGNYFPGFCVWVITVTARLRKWIQRQRWLVWLWKNRILSIIPLAGFYLKTNKLGEDLEGAEQRIIALTESNAFLRERLHGQRLRLDDFENPAWEKLKKGDRFIMLKVNSAYADAYLKSLGLEQSDYMGKTDFQVQDSANAWLYYQEDMEVSLTGKQKVVASLFTDRQGNVKEILVLKWRRIDRNDTIVMGEAIDLKEVRQALKELDQKKNE